MSHNSICADSVIYMMLPSHLVQRLGYLYQVSLFKIFRYFTDVMNRDIFNAKFLSVFTALFQFIADHYNKCLCIGIFYVLYNDNKGYYYLKFCLIAWTGNARQKDIHRIIRCQKA